MGERGENPRSPENKPANTDVRLGVFGRLAHPNQKLEDQLGHFQPHRSEFVGVILGGRIEWCQDEAAMPNPPPILGVAGGSGSQLPHACLAHCHVLWADAPRGRRRDLSCGGYDVDERGVPAVHRLSANRLDSRGHAPSRQEDRVDPPGCDRRRSGGPPSFKAAARSGCNPFRHNIDRREQKSLLVFPAADVSRPSRRTATTRTRELPEAGWLIGHAIQLASSAIRYVLGFGNLGNGDATGRGWQPASAGLDAT